MKSNSLLLAFALGAALVAAASCKKEARNMEPLIDPWLRERTPVNVRLESQIGAAVISDDWRNDAVGTVSVSLITGALDLTKVKVEAIDFKFPDSEYCPTASIGPGSTLDLSSGQAEFVVTAYNGETRTYTLSYTTFNDPLVGTYSFNKISGILDASNAPKCSLVLIGGWEAQGAVVCSTVMDKWWHWGTGYMPTDEDDNILSFRLESADAETGATYGTVVNTPGPDGKYANYVYANTTDVNDSYRLIPAGKGRWAKTGKGVIEIYAWEDADYNTPLYSLDLLTAGEHSYDGKTVNVPSLAFLRSFPGPFNTVTDWNDDTRWFVVNLRRVFWLIQKDGDQPLDNHSELLAE